MDITTELKHNATLLRTAEAIIQSVRDERDWFKAQLLKRDAEVERLSEGNRAMADILNKARERERELRAEIVRLTEDARRVQD